jgi:uncharacterized membrane protein YtjA (UPF0391 family)
MRRWRKESRLSVVVSSPCCTIKEVRGDSTIKKERQLMLSWAITFLVIAIIAAVLGFGGIAGTAAGIAKILFFVFLVLFVVSLIFGRGRAA